MKTAIKIFPLILLFGILYNCSSAKYSADFKSQKKELETLTLLTPLVNVVAITGQESQVDTALNNSLRLLIENQTFDLLTSKYSLEKKQILQIDPKIFEPIYMQLENSEKKISGVKCDTLLKLFNQKYSSRFALLITYNGKVNTAFEPHYNVNASLATNSFIIAPYTKPYSDLRLLILDTEQKEIVFFNRINSSNFDPRVESEMEQITNTILKKIYYK